MTAPADQKLIMTGVAPGPLILDLTETAINNAQRIHVTSNPALQREIGAAKQAVLEKANQHMATLKNELKIAQVLSGIVSRDEKLLIGADNSGLEFNSVSFEFTDRSGVDGTKLPGAPAANPFSDVPWLARGQHSGTVMLTDQRLLLISTKPSTTVSMTAKTLPSPTMSRTGKPNQYAVFAEATELLEIFPIPLSAFTHVSLLAKVGTKSLEVIESDKEKCLGCSCSGDMCNSCWNLCCHCEPCRCFGCCPKVWRRQASPISLAENHRVLQFGLVLPPWNKPAIMLVECNPMITLAFVQHVMSTFEGAWRPLAYNRK